MWRILNSRTTSKPPTTTTSERIIVGHWAFDLIHSTTRPTYTPVNTYVWIERDAPAFWAERERESERKSSVLPDSEPIVRLSFLHRVQPSDSVRVTWKWVPYALLPTQDLSSKRDIIHPRRRRSGGGGGNVKFFISFSQKLFSKWWSEYKILSTLMTLEWRKWSLRLLLGGYVSSWLVVYVVGESGQTKGSRIAFWMRPWEYNTGIKFEVWCIRAVAAEEGVGTLTF